MSAVDEGRNPYGTPGRGNADKAWRQLLLLPCPTCGATSKRLTLEGRDATVRCGPAPK